MATPEELLALTKIRGLDKGFQRTPLREFKGVLEGITASLVDRFQPPRTEIIFNFTDMNVIETVEPYPFPIAQISIMQSNREQSFWGVFAESAGRLVPEGVIMVAQLIDYLQGKVLHMKLTSGHMMWDRDKGEETPRDCWELVGVEGVVAQPASGEPVAIKEVGVSPTDVALKLLDGKNIQDWNQIVFQDPAVKSDGDLITSILNNTFIPSMKEKGIVSVDENGVHHVTKGD